VVAGAVTRSEDTKLDIGRTTQLPLLCNMHNILCYKPCPKALRDRMLVDKDSTHVASNGFHSPLSANPLVSCGRFLFPPREWESQPHRSDSAAILLTFIFVRLI
jgi:hypothetical protein